MKLKQAIEKLGANSAILIAEEIAGTENISWDGGAKFVFSVIANDLERTPGNIGAQNDTEQDSIKKWLIKYQTGFESRASKRLSNPLGTVADPIIEKIIGSRLDNLSDDDLNKITFAHRLGMSAENILGIILEEYLSISLRGNGWHCAWGETVKSVDFVNEGGSLLQIKNRSNSENSSSSSVRDGTEIRKWYRIRADRVEYMWPQLNVICGTNNLSEDNFVSFARSTINTNPDCLAVESNNPWSKF